jgi:hypothetical protein
MIDIRRKLIESPAIKVTAIAITALLSNVFAAAFIIDITNSYGHLGWLSFYKSIYFYLGISLFILLYFYYRAIYNYDNNLENFLDLDYCKAYMRRECLPELAKKAKEDIKNNKNGAFFSTIEEIEKTFKKKRKM